MEKTLREKTAEVVKNLYGQELSPELISVNIPPKEYPCDFTIVIFPIAKQVKKTPDLAAKEIGDGLKKLVPEIESFEVVKGFLNLKLSDGYWINFFSTISQDPSFGFSPSPGKMIASKEAPLESPQKPETGKAKKIMIEFGGPNTNKPLHLGHLRNIFIGWSMAQILEAVGNEVVKVNIYNDRGVHICKSMLAYQQFGNGETPASSSKKGDHLVGDYYVLYNEQLKMQASEFEMGGISEKEAQKTAPLALQVQDMLVKWEEGDPEVRALWNLMNGWVYDGFEETYRRLGINYDKAYYESQTYQLGKDFVEEGLKMGVFFRKEDGSAWVDLSGDGLDQKLLLRADGTSVYITQDIGTANERWNDYHPDKMIYTVANEQDYHFKALKVICRKLRKPYAEGMYHLSYGMIDLPSGRMKSREGTVVDADDLVDEVILAAEKQTKESGKLDDIPEEDQKDLFRIIGLGALKFFILKVDPRKRMIFNPEESIDLHGFTGPFIQYTYARIRSLIRKAGKPLPPFENVSALAALQSQERELILSLQRLPGIILEAASVYDPSVLANYLYHLAKAYNQFYHELQILNAPDEITRSFRVHLSSFVGTVIKKGMKLLGIEVPERM